MPFYIEVQRLRPRRDDEWTALMLVCNEQAMPATELAGKSIVESFGNARIYRNMLRDTDLDPAQSDAHRNSARFVLSRMVTGRPGRFTVRPDGTFLDFHGGNGLAGIDGLVSWFTPAALERGIGWTFIQTYRFKGRAIAHFHVSRIFKRGTPYRLEVRKTRV